MLNKERQKSIIKVLTTLLDQCIIIGVKKKERGSKIRLEKDLKIT